MRHKVKSVLRRIESTPTSGVLVRLVVCVVSGCLWFLSCADYDIWPFAWFAMVPTFWAIKGQTPRRAFLYAWVTGIVANGGGFYWIVGLLKSFGNMPTVAAVPIFLLACAYQGLVFGIWGWFWGVLQKRHKTHAVWVGSVFMVGLELVVPFVFPWYLAITQAWVIPVIQIADITGPLGVSFLLLMVNGLLYDLSIAWLDGKRFPLKREVLPVVGVLVFVLIYGYVRINQYEKLEKDAPKVKVGVVQPNIGISLKGKPDFAQRQLEIHQELSRKLQSLGAELIVWPESSYPYPLSRTFKSDAELNPRRGRIRDGFDVPIIFGTLTVDWDEKTGKVKKVYNSAIMLDRAGKKIGLFDKMYLLIFGEYIPLYEELEFMQRFFKRHRMSNFTRGDEVTVFPFWHQGEKFLLGPLICYEDIIPAFGRRVARLKPNLFINVTNDAWFGETSEPYQHLALAVYRSVEHRIPMVRAVNTGVSTLIDSTGRVVRSTPAVGSRIDSDPGGDSAAAIRQGGYKKLRPGVYQSKDWPYAHIIIDEVALMEPPATIYAAVGDVFGYGNLLLSLYLLFLFKRGALSKLLRKRMHSHKEQTGRSSRKKERSKKPKAGGKGN